jgi:mRNA-decapping enzyme subunit 2
VQDEHDDLVEAGLASMGESSGWSEEEMFSTNERLIGRKIEYDGNPHVFAEEGLAKGDPHAFRVVGGTFLNSSGGIGSLAPPPERSLLQPLFLSDGPATNNNTSSTVEGLTPFFSSDGATPWGEVVQDAKAVMTAGPAREIASSTKKKSRDRSKQKQIQAPPGVAITANTDDELFLTDRQITQKSQAEKSASFMSHCPSYEKSMARVRQWVENLPKPVPTKHFGLFHLDIDAIMAQAERDVPALKPRTSTIV